MNFNRSNNDNIQIELLDVLKLGDSSLDKSNGWHYDSFEIQVPGSPHYMGVEVMRLQVRSRGVHMNIKKLKKVKKLKWVILDGFLLLYYQNLK